MRIKGAITLMCLGLLLAGCAPPSLEQPHPSATPEPVSAVEPPATSAFLAAYAAGDEVAAERLASPLYRAEWERRGWTDRDLDVLRPDWFEPGPSRVWIRFTYIGGAADSAGFGRLLFAGQSTGGDGAGGASVWRVDTAPDGRVIWAELVWLFGEAGPVMPADATRSLAGVALPPALAALHPRPLVAARSEASGEAYYLADATAHGQSRVIFFALDQEGQFRPGAWSYGADNAQPSEYGRPSVPHPVVLAPDLAALEGAYLDTLW
jgi:hypothetical protein